MQVCPKCSFQNRPGVMFCENCGVSLIGEAVLSTRTFAKSGTGEMTDLAEFTGSELFPVHALVRFEIDGAEPIIIKPKEETVFGRRDPATGTQPDVDLTPFAGYRMGVSRRHALIKHEASGNKLELWDLGSSNGTFLNGTRLTANRPYRLRDGDEIRFGQMMLRMYFQPGIAVAEDDDSSSEDHEKTANPPTSNS